MFEHVYVSWWRNSYVMMIEFNVFYIIVEKYIMMYGYVYYDVWVCIYNYTWIYMYHDIWTEMVEVQILLTVNVYYYIIYYWYRHRLYVFNIIVVTSLKYVLMFLDLLCPLVLFFWLGLYGNVRHVKSTCLILILLHKTLSSSILKGDGR